MLNSQTWPCLGCQIVPTIGMRSPTFQPKRFARSTPTIAPWRSASHACLVFRRDLELRVDLHERLGLDRPSARRSWPGPGRRRRTTSGASPASRLRSCCSAIEVRHRQRHDQADLVDQDQPIEPGDVDAEREGACGWSSAMPNSRKATKTDSSVKMVRIFFRHRLLQSKRQELHACTPSISTPFSRCSVRLARSAARGSCVTMTMVLP